MQPARRDAWNRQIDSRLAAQLARMEADRTFLRRANVGVESMPVEDAERVLDIASAYSWRDPHGNSGAVPHATTK